jgi:hypothetical protein
MALSGHKFECTMSAFRVAIGGKADMARAMQDVRF